MGEIVGLQITPCWPWHLHFMAEFGAHPRGDQCRFCGVEIAMDPAKPIGSGSCIYCAMDRGLIEAIDRPFP